MDRYRFNCTIGFEITAPSQEHAETQFDLIKLKLPKNTVLYRSLTAQGVSRLPPRMLLKAVSPDFIENMKLTIMERRIVTCCMFSPMDAEDIIGRVKTSYQDYFTDEVLSKVIANLVERGVIEIVGNS